MGASRFAHQTMEEEDGRMTKAARIAAFFIAVVVGPVAWLKDMLLMIRHHRAVAISLFAITLLLLARSSHRAIRLSRLP